MRGLQQLAPNLMPHFRHFRARARRNLGIHRMGFAATHAGLVARIFLCSWTTKATDSSLRIAKYPSRKTAEISGDQNLGRSVKLVTSLVSSSHRRLLPPYEALQFGVRQPPANFGPQKVGLRGRSCRLRFEIS